MEWRWISDAVKTLAYFDFIYCVRIYFIVILSVKIENSVSSLTLIIFLLTPFVSFLLTDLTITKFFHLFYPKAVFFSISFIDFLPTDESCKP